MFFDIKIADLLKKELANEFGQLTNEWDGVASGSDALVVSVVY